MIEIVIRVSKGGVPHTIYHYKGKSFSVCYFGKTNNYRIFDWMSDDNKKLADIIVKPGNAINLIEEFDKLI